MQTEAEGPAYAMQTSDGDEEYERPVDDIEAESLAALDWPDLCAQVQSVLILPGFTCSSA